MRAFLSGQRDVDLVQMAGAIEQPVQRAPIGQQLATCVITLSPPLEMCVPIEKEGKGENGRKAVEGVLSHQRNQGLLGVLSIE
ncbi:hypothetical protein AVKW3434_21785 [Acidovorax sp. SUPP3434]|uniref:hypothetical protein n=1 Tax=Acidovorax sp. SUPP3434 TaxID=2920880 RepID=UPI0023DE3B1F|nr:hypothetical protein [Acidovorax sp. SUPP3434]GKT02068.1 hypothetical protein AVKW3434_21785 [Acidovorax sp. SUPP3434]